MAKEITVYPTRGHLLKIGDEYYKLKAEEKDKDERTIVKEVYEEINPEAYIRDIKLLADDLDDRSNISLKAIIEDALKDLPLDRVMAIGEQLKEDKVRIENRPSGCVELVIGDEFLVLRS